MTHPTATADDMLAARATSVPDQTTVTAAVNAALEAFYETSIARAAAYNQQASELWNVLRQVTMAGGKRLRPYLLLFAYQAYGGTDVDLVMPVAVAHELLHSSLLMHDDIIDQDTMRHGQANVSGSMEATYQQLPRSHNIRHYADGAALLGGDLLIGAAHALISESALPDWQKIIALRELSDAIFYVGIGEFLDMESVLRPFDQTDAMHIAQLKTASYTFLLPLRTGALLAGASKQQVRRLERFGTALGLAFQLADDVLGVFGDERVTGKSASSDIREGKHTYLMERTIARSSAADHAFIQRVLGKQRVSLAQLKRMQQLITDSGAKADTLQKISTLSQEARDIVETLAVPADAKQAFRDIITSATKRVL